MSDNKQYPELPEPTAWRTYDNLLKRARYNAVPITSMQPGIYSHTRMFTEDQMRAYVDADRAMRASRGQAPAPAAVAGQCEDAIELLGKYKELCEEIKRGDSYHIGRIDAAISVLAQAAPQPAVQQGDADVEGAIKSAFFRFFGAGAERDWYTEPGSWFIEGYRAAHTAAPVAQGDAEDAARWNVWVQAMVEACNSEDSAPPFLLALEAAIDDTQTLVTVDLFNAWVDAARAQQGVRNTDELVCHSRGAK